MGFGCLHGEQERRACKAGQRMWFEGSGAVGGAQLVARQGMLCRGGNRGYWPPLSQMPCPAHLGAGKPVGEATIVPLRTDVCQWTCMGEQGRVSRDVRKPVAFGLHPRCSMAASTKRCHRSMGGTQRLPLTWAGPQQHLEPRLLHGGRATGGVM